MRGRAIRAGTDPAQAPERAEAGGRPVTSGAGPPLGLVGSLVIAAVGLLVSVVAVVITTGTLARSASYRAQAQVAIVGPETGGNSRRLTALTASGAPAKAASAVLLDRDVGWRAVAGITGSPAISAVAAQETITVSVTASSAADAERVAQSVVDIGLPAAAAVIAPLRLVETDSPAGTAVTAGLSAGVVTAVTAPAGFMLGALLALVIRWLLWRRPSRSPGPG